MELSRKVSNWKNRTSDKIFANPKVIKFSISLSIIYLPFSLIVGYIIAQFSPGRYNLLDNYISDLGSSEYTTLPVIMDFGFIVSSILMIPSVLFLGKCFVQVPISNMKHKLPKARIILSRLGTILMFLGIIGLFMIGIFSVDRSTSFGLHYIFARLAFSGFILSSVILGLLVIFYETGVPKLVGFYMLLVPIITGVNFIVDDSPINEWIMLFSIMLWIIPVYLILLKKLKE
ncbi:MAG: DUF998 domain-containing protein [Candidatus Lokiarchaeota archaeon]|nr:DUF998 domain-containing protein [Candidatus Lokiarchaeota archaeon]